jgi:hypothetical protein
MLVSVCGLVAWSTIAFFEISASSTKEIFFDCLIFFVERLIEVVSSIFVCSATVGASLFVGESCGIAGSNGFCLTSVLREGSSAF